MEEHEQLNLNRFILKSHLLLKAEGETPCALFHCFRSTRGKRQDGEVVQSQGNAESRALLQLLCDPGQAAPSL